MTLIVDYKMPTVAELLAVLIVTAKARGVGVKMNVTQALTSVVQ